jgi:AcrR family transcriptional regulator
MNSAETHEKLDRRVARTRHALRDALMALIVERGFDNITLQDITDRANVSRPTFYLHYANKEELLFKSMKEIYDSLATSNRGKQPETSEGFSEAFHELCASEASDFQHVEDHAAFYRAVLSEHGVPSFTKQVHEYLANTMQQDWLAKIGDLTANTRRVPINFMANYLAGAEIGVIRWWLSQEPRCTPEQMARMMYYMSAFGFWWALGLNLPQPEDNPMAQPTTP